MKRSPRLKPNVVRAWSLESMGASAETLMRSILPDPFVLVLLLTLIAFSGAFWFSDTTPHDALRFWSMGFWELLSFAMQMALIIVTGEAIVASPSVKFLIRTLCSVPQNRFQSIMLLTIFALITGWIHWGIGLIGSSLLARELAIQAQHKRIQLHYPLLGACAYMSMLLWHAGTTASAPLLINTPQHFLFNEIGIIPLDQTIFETSNLVVCAVLTILVPVILYLMHPTNNIRSVDQFALYAEKSFETTPEKPKTLAEKLEHSALTNRVIGAIMLSVSLKSTHLSDLNHNAVNFLLIGIGLLLHRSPIQYMQAISKSAQSTAGVLIQFPFYGGVMALLRETHLGADIAQVFLKFANQTTLPFFAYLASLSTKFFIPSGGGEWAVEGPVFLKAAKLLQASVGKTTMGVAYGNMVGNLLQPFWAVPLLSILKLEARDIMGFCLVVFLFAFPILGIALLS